MSSQQKVEIRLQVVDDIFIPSPATPFSCGFDLRACIEQPVEIPPGGRALIPAGVKVEIPPGYCGMVVPRSGLAINYGITVLNAPGIIDPDYRGEVKIILVNHSQEKFVVRRGDRIAQLLIVPYFMPEWKVAESLTETQRGVRGFGSSGIN